MRTKLWIAGLAAALFAVAGCTEQETPYDPLAPGDSEHSSYADARDSGSPTSPSEGSGKEEGSTSDGEYAGDDGGYTEDPSAPGDDYIDGEGENGGQGSASGVLTAGEWNDLTHWDFWCQLMKWQPEPGQEGDGAMYVYDDNGNYVPVTFSYLVDYWGFCTDNRVAVQVNDTDGQPVTNVTVDLLMNGDKVWSAKTDNRGRANCWYSFFQRAHEVNPEAFRIALDGEVMETAPEFSFVEDGVCKTNTYVVPAKGRSGKAQIAFIVDATGSMYDEIFFLQEDLDDIIKQVMTVANVQISTGALFYRDIGDTYITRASDFNDFSVTRDFIAQQSADGGGDYPEAVHTALEKTLADLTWDDSARTRMAFMILDAPAHHETYVIESLQKSIAEFSNRGIILIPVAASGIDKSCEFMLRCFAIGTGGTYVFLTDDSGVGGEHILATVGDYEVEKLNELIVRLILEAIA